MTTTTTPPKERVFLSFDIEADGPSPSVNSMIALGVCVVRANDKVVININDEKEWLIEKKDFYFTPLIDKEVDKNTYDEFWSKHLDVYNHIMKNGRDAFVVTNEFIVWYQNLTVKYDVKWIANPAAFDWQWVNAYVHAYVAGAKSIIPYTATCISSTRKTLKRMGVDFSDMNQRVEKYPLTHNPSDDAIRQAVMYMWMQTEIADRRENWVRVRFSSVCC